MSTPTEISLSRAIQAHDGTVKSEVPSILDRAGEIDQAKAAIYASVDSLLGTELNDGQKSTVDGIRTSLDGMSGSVNSIKDSANALKAGSNSLIDAVPNSSEFPKVSTGTSGNGTATRPGSDNVQDDDRRGGTLG